MFPAQEELRRGVFSSLPMWRYIRFLAKAWEKETSLISDPCGMSPHSCLQVCVCVCVWGYFWHWMGWCALHGEGGGRGGGVAVCVCVVLNKFEVSVWFTSFFISVCLSLTLSTGMFCFVCWLLIVPATCECISGTDLHRQFYVLPHWDRSCRSNFPSHPVPVLTL